MYKLVGIGLASILAMMVVPGFSVDSTESSLLYGAATFIVKDSNGNPIFEQIIHNQLTDQGEDQIIMNLFAEGGTGDTINDAQQVGAICITDNLDSDISGLEGETATTFDADTGTSRDALDTKGGGNCRTDTDVDNSTASIALIGPLTFTASISDGANLGVNDRIDAIGICNADSGDANFTGCLATGSKIFAVVNVSNVTLAESETVTIDYEFDITSDTT